MKKKNSDKKNDAERLGVVQDLTEAINNILRRTYADIDMELTKRGFQYKVDSDGDAKNALDIAYDATMNCSGLLETSDVSEMLDYYIVKIDVGAELAKKEKELDALTTSIAELRKLAGKAKNK